MKIDMQAAIALMNEADEINDGLFTVSGQLTLIEMTHYGLGDDDVYLIETFVTVNGPFADGLCNSTEPLGASASVRDVFPVCVDSEAYSDRVSAMARYFELIEQHNRAF